MITQSVSSGPVTNFPFLYFGFRLWKAREVRGLRSTQMAELLGIPHAEYRYFESGARLPDRFTMLDLSKVLQIDLARLKKWETHAAKSIETSSINATKNHSKAFKEALERASATYIKHLEVDPDEDLVQFIDSLEQKISRMVTFPVLPTNLLMLLYALEGEITEVKYLHEANSFILEKETLAGFLARDFYFGPFFLYAANQVLYRQSPCKSLMDCLNRLNIDQFRELLYFSVSQNGLYHEDQFIPAIQQHLEFCSLAVLMARELEPHLPKDVDYHHLSLALLMQGLGVYILYILLQPYMKQENNKHLRHEDKLIAEFNREFVELVIYELHPVVAAILSANWQQPPEVQDILVSHHQQPASEVSSACAVLKLINYLTDQDFPVLSKESLANLLQQYPQVDISLESLLQVCTKLNRFKDNLIQRSSTVVENASPEAAQYACRKAGEVSVNPMLAIKNPRLHLPPRRSDFRFDPAYQKALLNECHGRLYQFVHQIYLPQKNEKLKDYANRIQGLQLKMDFLLLQDISELVHKHGISIDEAQVRLEM